MSRSRMLIFLVLLLVSAGAIPVCSADQVVRGDLRLITTTTVTTAPPATGILYIDSVPAGALVSVDGTAAGTAPVMLNPIASGWHTVTLKLAGYSDYTTQINVPVGSSIRQVYTLTQL